MTDCQQPLAVALTQANGLSTLQETVYENRLGFLEVLANMGATVQPYRECLGATPCRFGARNYTHSAVICGPAKLEAAELSIPDLRGEFSHVIAALAAQGTSTIDGVEIINRGYESFTTKLTGLGADIDLNGCGGAAPPLAA
jgi:UDP-N-acetylglucosamine 1-carboxyvinyltransferase